MKARYNDKPIAGQRCKRCGADDLYAGLGDDLAPSVAPNGDYIRQCAECDTRTIFDGKTGEPIA